MKIFTDCKYKRHQLGSELILTQSGYSGALATGLLLSQSTHIVLNKFSYLYYEVGAVAVTVI